MELDPNNPPKVHPSASGKNPSWANGGNTFYFPGSTNNSQPPKTLAPPPKEDPSKPDTSVNDFWAKILASVVSAMPMSPSAADRQNGVPYDGKPKSKGDGASGDSGVKPSTPAVEMYNVNKVSFTGNANGLDMSVDEFEDAVLQEIGGRELLIMERHDMVDGINQKYEPIQNLSRYALQHSPTNIDPYPNTVIDFFEGMIFEINDHIPTTEELTEDGQPALVYFDETNNNIVINVSNLLDNQFVEVEFVSYEEVISDTIYV